MAHARRYRRHLPLTGLRSAPFSRTAVTRAARQGEPARAGARQASRHGMGPRRRKETGWKPRQPNSPAHNQAVCMRSVLSLPSIPPAQIGSGVGKVLRLRLRAGAGHGFAVRVRLPSSHGVRGCRREARNDGHDPRAGARAGAAGVGARTCLVFGLAASTSASTWSCPPHSAGDKGTGACCRHGQAEVFSSWCISPACGSSVQVSRAARTAAGSAPGKRPAIRGNQWLRTTFGLKHHQVRPACHRRPAWLRPLLRIRLDIDRWSASSTVVELIPCGRARPTAAYFRAGHLLLDLLTRSLLQYLPAADARDTASQPHVPVSSGHP